MLRRMRAALALFVMLFAAVNALSGDSVNTLVIYDQRVTDLENYTKFFKSLKESSYDKSSNQREYRVQFAAVNNGDAELLQLYRNDDKLYDNLIIFPLKTRQISKEISTAKLLEFYKDGGDILAVTSPEGLVEPVRLFLNELGIYPSPKNAVLKNFNEDGPSSKHQISIANSVNKYVYDGTEELNLEYDGSSALLDNGEYIVEILRAPRESVCKNTNSKEEDWSVGSQGHLIAGFQSLTNARTTWVGSSSFFDDEHYSANGAFIEELTKWAFSEKSVIRSVGATHNHASGASYEEIPYKIKDEVVYEIGLSIWDGKKWAPFSADDVQFELRLVDPYYRLTLSPGRVTEDTQYYTTGTFKLPDHHGMFTFLTEYKRSGLSFVTESDTRAIRHLANDEYPRSYEITNSWVYLTAIGSVIISFILFVVFFIASSKNIPVDSVKKQQ
ncbi:unnamed protein product [Kluyveromyces dobzhanskii CBS 2104]|uniref:Dolichyl-diphosphooligosaccharide--protein glycosyltransferase subunit WBP1 n=1 Tax=Kluyveromyces dobzhanskii CBS 2104 TaxID=1427455 RepID=A0A0A8L6R3_9SACH|nr:unnamed protein product [Kluyveromyces dobzhanskii CBS 2104]